MKDKSIEETLYDFASQLFVEHNIMSTVTITSNDIHHRLRTCLGYSVPVRLPLDHNGPIVIHAPALLMVIKKDEN